MNNPIIRPTYMTPRPEVCVIERGSLIGLPRDDPFFQGWGPKL